MSLSTRSRKIVVIAVGGLAVATVSGVVGTASATHPTASECRASLVRVTAPGVGTVEPVVASGAAGCTTQNAGAVNPAAALPSGLGTIRALYASTNAATPLAEAGVLDLTLTLPGAPLIRAQVLTSEARVTCNGGTPAVVGESHVAKVTVGTTVVEIPPAGATVTQTVGPVTVVLNETPATAGAGTFRALRVTVGAPVGAEVVVAESQVTPGSDACQPHTTPTTPPPTTNPRPVVGWMTGGGQLPGGVTHSLVLPCTTSQKHPNTKLHVETANGKFDLTTLSSVGCSMVPANGDPEQPDAAFNTLTGKGTGSCNGHDGVDASFTFTDGGEPNKGNDKASVTIDKDNTYGCHVSITGATVNGNQQAHRGSAPPS